MYKIIFSFLLLSLVSCKTPSHRAFTQSPQHLSERADAAQILLIYYEPLRKCVPLMNEIIRQKGIIVYNYRTSSALAVRFPVEKNLTEVKSAIEKITCVVRVEESHTQAPHQN